MMLLAKCDVVGKENMTLFTKKERTICTHSDDIRVLFELLATGRDIDNLAADARLCVFSDGRLPPPAVVHRRLQVIVLGGVVPLALRACACRNKMTTSGVDFKGAAAYHRATLSSRVRRDWGLKKECGYQTSTAGFWQLTKLGLFVRE